MKKIVVIFIALSLILFVAYGYTNKNKLGNEKVNEPASVTSNNLIKKVYSNTDLGFSINMPEDYKVVKEGDYSVRIMPDTEVLGMGPTNFVYISVVKPEMKNSLGEIYNYNAEQFKDLIALENVGDSVDLSKNSPVGMGEWFTYTVVAVEDIDNGKVKNFQNLKPWEFPSGTTENRFIYGTEKNIYILGYYTGGEGIQEDSRIDPRIAYSMIKSFKASR
ncbi:MAG: hypothetical protein WA152_02310 [Microgenomates group bacterium]